MANSHMGGWIFISGATSTIGKTIVLEVAKQGDNIIAHGRNEKVLQDLCEETKDLGIEFKIFPYNLSEIENLVDDLSAFLIDNALSVSAFIHVAGHTDLVPIKNLSYNTALNIMNINFFSAQQIVSTLMKKRVNKQNLSNIIFITSIASTGGKKYQHIYTASKGALETFANTLALELAPTVRVNTIRPGSIRTKMGESTFRNDALRERLEEVQVLGSGSTKDIAPLIIFLLSDSARWITGQHINVDGGETLLRVGGTK
jgi:NAD(P)-dependent dehydrogenase (short-subunit alcohol dehydrogenase family)